MKRLWLATALASLIGCSSNPSSVGSADASPDAHLIDSGSCATGLCNGTCCGADQICVTVDGVEACADSCASDFALTATCGGATPCCMQQYATSDAGKIWNGRGACLAEPPTGFSAECLCKLSSECPGGSCAPSAVSATNGAAFSVCQPNDGEYLHGCSANCGNCNDCVVDCAGNHYCASSSATGCSGGTCPSPNWCIVQSPTCNNSIETCTLDCMLCACE